MKVGFFNFGNTYIPAKAVLKRLGIEYVEINSPNKKNFSKGLEISPEFSCLPFKVLIGTTIDAIEKGAKALVLPSGTSITACQSADYATAKKYILQRKGYDVDIIMLKNLNPKGILDTFKRYNPKLNLKITSEALIIFSQKIILLEEIEDISRNIYLIAHKKKSEQFRKRWENKIEKTDSIIDLHLLRNKLREETMRYSDLDISNRLKVAVIGDIYCINESFINNKIFERLCDLDVYPVKTHQLRMLIANKITFKPEELIYKNKARKYLRYNIGGFSLETISKAIKYSEEKFDGLIHIYPFNCMPETVVRSILPKISKDYDIPILYLPIDEHTGDAGFTTRIEAFIDLIKIRKHKFLEKKKSFNNKN